MVVLGRGGLDAFGGNARTMVIDAALLFGDDPYQFPQHLPKVTPPAVPAVSELRVAPDPANYPVKALLTDTG